MTDEELARFVKEKEARDVAVYPKRFYYKYDELPDGSKRTTEMVALGKRGTSVPFELNKRWRDVSPVEKIALQPYYDSWKKGETTPIIGTPLEAWTADGEMVEVLNQVNIRSVEDFVKLEDHLLVRLSIPNGREKRSRAQAYLESRQGAASATEVASLREENSSLKRDVAELRALIERHAIKKDEAVKRGPGRPRKEPIEAMN